MRDSRFEGVTGEGGSQGGLGGDCSLRIAKRLVAGCGGRMFCMLCIHGFKSFALDLMPST